MDKELTKSVVEVTIQFVETQKERDFIPDYMLRTMAGKTGLSLDDCREIRDMVQQELHERKLVADIIRQW